MKKRVVVTGMGVLSPVGNDLDQFWASITGGKSGIDTITRFDTSDYPAKIAGEVRGFDPTQYMDRKEARRMDRFSQYAIAAARMALDNSGLEITDQNRDRIGCIFGTGIGGIETFVEQLSVLDNKGPGRVSPFFIPMMIANIAAGRISIEFGARGPNNTVVTACAASAHAMGEAYRLVSEGYADAVITGGSEAPLVPIALVGFANMKALSTSNDDPQGASRPFDKDRDGFVMAEGAGVVVMETLESAVNRNATIYAEILGYGSTADGYHISAPAPECEGGARAMQLALNDAGLAPDEIDYINAHGTSTPMNDKLETIAIRNVFGDHADKLAVSSIKSMTGHLLGAAGCVEAIASIMSIVHGLIPPTINLNNPDPDCDLDYVANTVRKQPVETVMSNSFGFGGQNACLVLGIRQW